MRALLAQRAKRARASRPRVELPAGHEAANPRGSFWLRRCEYSVEARHGVARFGDLAGIDWSRIAVLAKSELAERVDLRDCLFLDTETTGLSGGAGTIVFNSGLGFFEDDQFVVEQTFLRRFGEEPAALQHVVERLEQRPVLVTFVGKAFDRHRLAARMAVAKVDHEMLTDRHLDLYYLARRAYKDRLPDTRLRTLEQRVLGVHRADDLPGSEAPTAFFEWMRDRTGPVDRVLEHNRLDVLSLVTLLGVLGGCVPAACDDATG